VIHGKESRVCRLNKASYGLKQAPCAWYTRIDGYLMNLGFRKSGVNANLYYKVVDENLYVDDIFLSQRKYIVEILRRFGILDCKSMTTSMVMNLKKMSESSSDSDLIDPTMYR
jgi:hypothetical protein